MNLIKIYLKPSGSTAELYKDFNLYQGSYRNVQISIYVPTEILYENAGNTYFNTVQTGAIMTAPNGAKVVTMSNNAAYVRTVKHNGVEYAEYTQVMPKEYAVYAGTQIIVCNVVNIDNTDESSPKIISVTTTQQAPLVVLESAYLSGEETLDPTEAEVIEGLINDLQKRLDNGAYGARSIYAWNAAYTYGAGELVFYPQAGKYGVFLKSLTENNNAAPYANGVLDTENWLLVSDFNILTELYTLKVDVQTAVQETRDNVAASEQSANEAESSSQQAAQSATAAENAAQRIESQAQYLEGVKDGTIAVPKATSDGNGENIAEHFETIESYIPSSTSAENQLADKAFVNSTVNNMSAFYITSNADGAAFKTQASLTSATVFYSGGKTRIPTQNDYATVLSDETQPKGVDGSYPTTRYIYQTDTQGGMYPDGQWEFQYVVNNTSLTQAQVDAINSGITKELVEKIDNGNVLSVNGETGAVTITPAKIGALPISGGTLSGKLILRELSVSQEGKSSIEMNANAVTPYIDFHHNNDPSDFTSRIIEGSKGVINVLPELCENGYRVYSANNPPPASVYVQEYGTGYMRFTNGLQICWGSYSQASSVGDKSGIVLTFPKAFKTNSTPSFIANAGKNDNSAARRSATTNFYSISNTSVSTGWYGDGSTMLTWVAVGNWK